MVTFTTEVPGALIWVACEMISVSPPSVNRLPSVATNDEIPSTDTASPLSKPTPVANSRAMIMAGISGSPTPEVSLSKMNGVIR